MGLMFLFFRCVLLQFFYLLKLNILGEMSTDKFETSYSDYSSSTSILWKYVTKLEKASDSDGNIVFRCKY